MPIIATPRKKRLTREESRAETRARLMAVGRKYFLRYGLRGAVAERIAEDAGYSRGAFYSNFDGMEELFLAVVMEEEERRFASFRAISSGPYAAADRLKRLRENSMNLLTDRDWIVLRAEFEASALVSERMRRSFTELYRRELAQATQTVQELANDPGIRISMPPQDLVLALLSFSHGLAVKQRILGADLPAKSTRALIGSFLDLLITAKSPDFVE
jgi:AcrR family transcriptional regulator